MLRSNSVWLVPVVLSLASLGVDATKAIAQTNYELEAIYNLEVRGSFQIPASVPEPENSVALMGIGAKGFSYCLRKS